MCDSVMSRTVGTVAIKTFGLALRSSLLYLSRHDLVSKFQPVSRSAATSVLKPNCSARSLKRASDYTSVKCTPHISVHILTRPCTDSLLGFPGNSFDVKTSSVSVSKSGLAFIIEAQRSVIQNRTVGFQHPTERRHWFVPCPQHTCSQPWKNRQEHLYWRWSLLQSEQSHTQRELVLSTSSSRPGRSCVLSLFWLFQPGFGLGFQDVCHVVFPASFALKLASSEHTLHRRGLARHCRRNCNILMFRKCEIICIVSNNWCLGLSDLPFQISPAFLHLQTLVALKIVPHVLSNLCPTLIRVRFCCLPMDSNATTRCTADRQVCPRDIAPT